MKTKYLFGMLLSGAMLAACTADDDLNSAKLAQVNQSAPVFTVSFDGDDDLQNRAVMKPDWNVGFKGGDKLSLFHGTKAGGDLSGWQNAVYIGGAEEVDGVPGAFTFTTQAMVQPGWAIMVYPADTEFLNGTNEETNLGKAAPNIMIPYVQDEDTKTLTPYMSEVINIKKYGENIKNDEAEAGYGNEYDIVLRRVGSTLSLSLDLLNSPNAALEEAGALPIELKKVAMVESNNVEQTLTDGVASEENGLFTYSIPTTASEKASLASTTKKHTSWVKQAELDQTKAKGKSLISTTDIAPNNNGVDVATFTLLPFNTNAKSENAAVVLYTSYGKAIMTNDSKIKDAEGKETTEIMHKTSNPKGDFDISGGLNEIIEAEYLWRAALGGTFYNEETKEAENTGAHVSRSINIDLANLDMNGLHIEDETQLINVSKALPVIGLKGDAAETVFYLDGHKSGRKNTFVIKTEEGYEAYKTIINYTDSKKNVVTLKLCAETGDEACKLVVLDNSAAVNGVVPAELKFGKVNTEKVLVQLEGTGWVLEGTQKFQGVDSLVVAKDAVVELKGVVNVANPAYDAVTNKTAPKFVATTALVNRAGGVINVNTGDVQLQMNTRNYGTINVNKRLRMSGQDVQGIAGTTDDDNITLVNEIYATKYSYGTADDSERGVINLKARLATVDDTNARIYNYGYIEILDENGSVLLYANGTEDADFAKALINKKCGEAKISDLHKGDNIFGVLKVIDNKASLSLTTILNDAKVTTTTPAKKNMKGFVKYETTGEIKAITNDGANLINYIKGKSFSTNSKDFYCELAEGTYVVSVATSITLNKGLIVPKGVTVSIEAGKTLSLPRIYLKGEVYRAGTFTTTGANPFVSYMGGEEDDKYNVSSAGNN